jgi:polysaccharide export outer membrane protein
MIFRLLVPFILLLAASGCTGGGMAPPAASHQQALDDAPYVIGIPDLLRITVWKHPDLSVEAPVRRDGKISVPLLDDVQAAGLTPEDLKQSVTKGLSSFISRPDVTVIVLSPDSQVVTVVGGVVQSGQVALRRRMDVIEAVAAAGGFSAWANKNDIRVIRSLEKRRVTYRFDYKAYLKGEPGAELLLQPGDVIVVPE